MKHPARLIDSHVHFYDRSRPEGVSWPPANESYPSKALPPDLAKTALPINLAGAVLVETGSRPADDDWLLKLAKNDPLILGVIANLQPSEAGFERRLEKSADHSKFKGIRLRPIIHYDLNSSALRNSLKKLSKYGLTLELGATSLDKLAHYTALAKELAETACGLTHFGHPVIDGSTPERTWCNAVLEFSTLPNTFCKFTSLETFAVISSKTRNYEFYRPTIDFLLSAFGENRVIFGSNWPHHSVIWRYVNNMDLYQQIFGTQTSTFDHLMFKNAALTYNLKLDNFNV